MVREIWAGDMHYQVTGDARQGHIEMAGQRATVRWALREVLVLGVLCGQDRTRSLDETKELDGVMAACEGLAHKAGLALATLRHQFPPVGSDPDLSQTSRMAEGTDKALLADLPALHGTLRQLPDGNVACVHGPWAEVMAACIDTLDSKGEVTRLDQRLVQERAAEMTNQGLQVVAFARCLSPAEPRADANHRLTLVGLMGLANPMRQDALAGLDDCRRLGLDVKWLSNMPPAMARYWARHWAGNRDSSAGAADPAETALLSGAESQGLTGSTLARRAAGASVLAMEQGECQRLVSAMNVAGEQVIAPSLLLPTVDFSLLARLIIWSRKQAASHAQLLEWALPTSFGLLLALLAPAVAGLSPPISALAMLWLASLLLLMVWPSLLPEPALTEQPEADAMPRARDGDDGLVWRVAGLGLLFLAAIFGSFRVSLVLGETVAQARTVALTVALGLSVAYWLLGGTSVRNSGSRWPRLLGIGVALGLHAQMLWLAPLRDWLGLASLSERHWLVILVAVLASAFGAIVWGVFSSRGRFDTVVPDSVSAGPVV